MQCLQVVWEWEGSPLLAGGGRAVVDRGRQGRYRGGTLVIKVQFRYITLQVQ